MALRPWDGAPRPPRRWQAEALPILMRALREGRRPVISAATGSGKSVLLSEVTYLAAERARGTTDVVLISTSTQDLVRQLSATIAERCGAERVGQFYADRKEPGRPIVVACNPSLPALARELAAAGRAVRVMIADECHLSEADTARTSVQALAPRFLLGCTATAWAPGKARGLTLFSDVAYRYTLQQALADGVLVPWRVVNYDGEGSDDADDVCEGFVRQARGPGIISAQSIDDAEAFAARLCANGLPVAATHSQLGWRESGRRRDALRSGELRALVHVAMLVEGVDYPWLRWLIVRRPSASARRFVQEIGRVLRTDPSAPPDDPKQYATIYDPHDLFGTLGLVHPERIGDCAAQLEQAMQHEASGSGGTAPREPMPRAVAVDQISRWGRATLFALWQAGLAEAPVKARSWRSGFPTAKQLAAIERLAHGARYLPEPSRGAIKALCRCAPELTAGGVSDAISVLAALLDAAAKAPPHARRFYHLPKAVSDVLPALDPATVEALALPRKAA
jgi:superfamily II DNA or RNA helicase